MKQRSQVSFIAWRFYLLIIFIMLIVLGLVARLVDLTVVQRHFLLGQGNARAVREITIPAFRGMITDRYGYPLAISTSVYSVWANPLEYSSSPQQLKQLGQLLGLKPAKIAAVIDRSDEKDREFVYLKRELSPEIAKQIKALKIPGIYLQEDYKRFYPEGEVAAHIIGFTNVDDQGQEGLELAYNEWLKGVPGKKLVIKDRLGRNIAEMKTLQQQKAGQDIALSINRRIQYLAYRELMAGVIENKAESGSIIVLDVKTGEIIAMVNQPSFNPNRHAGVPVDNFRNRAVTDTFEPGSTMKAFSIASVLDTGLYHPNSLIQTSPGWMVVGRHMVRDEHDNGLISLAQVLQYSSNVGTTKMILNTPPNHLRELLHNVGFGESTGIGFPGERSGELIQRTKWDPFTLATLSFGYGLSITELQLVQAYSVIANHGMKVPLSLLRVDTPPAGKRVMKAKLADEMLHLLETVVTEKRATGELASIPGYRVAGKTGTARMVGQNGYESRHHVSSFVGIAPVSNPRYLVAVVIRDPQGKHYFGSFVSAPIFKKIMEETLHALNVPPDNIESAPTQAG
jgi:cell division protein FtsI (penicillin-binding protein 3)